MGDLFLSKPEVKAETLRRIQKVGRASFAQAAIILDHSQPWIRGKCDEGEMEFVQFGKRRYVLLKELERWKALLS